jgi:PAS domain S-box-containing protein
MEYPCHAPTEQRWFLMHVSPLGGGQRGAVVAHENITGLKLAEVSIRESEERFRRLIENASDVIAVVNGAGLVEFQSPSTQRVLGYAPDEILGHVILDFIHVEDRSKAMQSIGRALENVLPSAPVEYRIRHRDGTWRIFQSIGRAMTDPTGGRRVVVNSRDITETRRLEDQFRQAQKMEAIGTLAGGIAHDFNNVLAAIVGYTELAKMESAGRPEVLEYLQAVSEGSARAADLVRQILAFSRQQEQQRKSIQLWPVVNEALKLLRATIPATIQFEVSLIRRGPTVLADPTQIHQVLMNLATNAAHAMRGQPGRLGVSLEVVDVDSALAAMHPGLRPGRYLRLVISDTGHGMDRATLARIFDPFYTTKAPGEGTGLGLAVVHGIMQSHDGVISVYSQPGEGTRFNLYFPAEPGEAREIVAPATETPRGHGERILYLDDEKPLVRMGQIILERLGYVVDAETTPAAAIAAVRAQPKKYDLVITDLAMPGMTGTDVAKQLLAIRPDLPIILSTGFSATLTLERVRAIGIREMVLKPLTLRGLGEVVHRVLTESKPT